MTEPPASTTPPPQIVEPLLSYRETGKLLGVTERTVFSLVAAGELPRVRFGRSVRIDPADLRAYIDRCKTLAPRESKRRGTGGGA